MPEMMYPPIVGIIPLVPIVPAMQRDTHRMWRSYAGYSFAMHNFIDIGLIEIFDNPEVITGMLKVDPLSFPEQLSKVPTMAIVSSGDEFMQFDWTEIWAD
jgi:PhoPQ-activated pathogenicity-related protein